MHRTSRCPSSMARPIPTGPPPTTITSASRITTDLPAAACADASSHPAGAYACAVGEPGASAAREAGVDAFSAAGHRLVDGVAEYLAALPSGPVWQPLPDALREHLLAMPLPEQPHPLDDLVATALRDVLPHPMGNGHPAFFGWVNPPPSTAGILASLAAAAMNPSVVAGDHADVHLERTVVRWLAELVGFPRGPGGG